MALRYLSLISDDPGAQGSKSFEIIDGMEIPICRASGALHEQPMEDNGLLSSPIISRNHAVIRFDSGKAYISDGWNGNPSTHGTAVWSGKHKYQLSTDSERRLYHNDCVWFGRSVDGGGKHYNAVRFLVRYIPAGLATSEDLTLPPIKLPFKFGLSQADAISIEDVSEKDEAAIYVTDHRSASPEQSLSEIESEEPSSNQNSPDINIVGSTRGEAFSPLDVDLEEDPFTMQTSERSYSSEAEEAIEADPFVRSRSHSSLVLDLFDEGVKDTLHGNPTSFRDRLSRQSSHSYEEVSDEYSHGITSVPPSHIRSRSGSFQPLEFVPADKLVPTIHFPHHPSNIVTEGEVIIHEGIEAQPVALVYAPSADVPEHEGSAVSSSEAPMGDVPSFETGSVLKPGTLAAKAKSENATSDNEQSSDDGSPEVLENSDRDVSANAWRPQPEAVHEAELSEPLVPVLNGQSETDDAAEDLLDYPLTGAPERVCTPLNRQPSPQCPDAPAAPESSSAIDSAYLDMLRSSSITPGLSATVATPAITLETVEASNPHKRSHQDMEASDNPATADPLADTEATEVAARPFKRSRLMHGVKHAAFAGMWMSIGACAGAIGTIYGLAAYADD